jgi:predicted nuclease of predicted toxin-antitoxin system
MLGGSESDQAIARYAADMDLTVVTKDRDFLALHERHGHKLIWLRCGNILNERLYRWIEQRWSDALAARRSGERIVVIS